MRKKIFRQLRRVFLRVSVLLLGAVLFWIPPILAAQVFHYRTYHPQTGEEFNRFDCSIEENSYGGYQVHWTIDEAGSQTQEDYTLGKHFETLRFRIINIDGKTDLTGAREGNMVFLRGQFKGEEIEKDLKVDEKPFYYNPKIGLVDFVRSGKKKMRFWGFQGRELKVYPMRAVNEGPDQVVVGGKRIDVLRVYWTVDDFRSSFFKRTYWFRASDGIYVKQKSSSGTFREFVGENNTKSTPSNSSQPNEMQ